MDIVTKEHQQLAQRQEEQVDLNPVQEELVVSAIYKNVIVEMVIT